MSSVEERIEALVSEAVDLRYREAGDPKGALTVPTFEHADEVMAELIRVRKRADRLDAIRTAVTRLKWQAKRALDDKKFEAEIAYDEAVLAARAARGANSFATRDDVKADASLGSIAQKREQRKAERLVDITAEAYELINDIHWQFGAMRRELMNSLHALQIDRNLDH